MLIFMTCEETCRVRENKLGLDIDGSARISFNINLLASGWDMKLLTPTRYLAIICL